MATNRAMDAESQLHRWRELLSEIFSITLGEIAIPEHKPGFDRLIVVPQGLTMEKVVSALRNNFFGVFLFLETLDDVVTENERDATNGSYAIWVRDCAEADEENTKKSADEIKATGLATETLMERLLHELVYYREREEHLDVRGKTLCSGSRISPDGHRIPYVGWNPDGFGEIEVQRWYSPSLGCSGIRAREVIS